MSKTGIVRNLIQQGKLLYPYITVVELSGGKNHILQKVNIAVRQFFLFREKFTFFSTFQKFLDMKSKMKKGPQDAFSRKNLPWGKMVD